MRFSIFFFLLGLFLHAQAAAGAQYTQVTDPFKTFNYIDTASGGTEITLGDNAASDPVDLGFTFNYYGTSHTQIIIGSNGTIGFPTETTGLDTTTKLPAVPDPTAPNAVIAPFSADLDPSSGGSIHYLQGGTTGSRYLAVEWLNVPLKDKGGIRSFEVVLYEDNGDILFQYKTLEGGEGIDSTTVTIGIENGDGLVGLTPADVTQIAEGTSILFSENPSDADGNGLIDRFESFYNLTGGGTGDDDGDGLSNADEFTAGTRPDEVDSDGDGISDKNDADPLSTDSDSDGLRDSVEDINTDGVRDGSETDAGSFDTDGDGYTDAAEITYGSDPRDAASTPSLNFTAVTTTIQAAIDNASAGERIYIPASTTPYVEDLTINKAITLIGAGTAFTTIDGTITVSGVTGATLTGFTISDATTAVEILGDATSVTDVNLTKVTLKNCTNGILISDAAASGGTAGTKTKAVLNGVTFSVTDPMTVGYGIKVEDLQDGTDDVLMNNASVTLTGSGGIIIDNSRNIEIRGTSVSRSETAGIVVQGDGVSSLDIDNTSLSGNYGTGITVAGNGTGIILNRDTLSGNAGSGIRLTGNASTTLTDNTITQNGGYGMEATSAPTVTNSGNALTGNTSGSYSSTSIFSVDTPADITGTSSTGQVIAQSVAWIPAATGGTVPLIEPPVVLSDPIYSLFGASITFPAGALSEDTRVTISKSTASYPSLPITFNYPMPLAEFSLEQGTLNGTATVTLPVLAGYDTDTARVFHLNGNTWEEVTAAPPVGNAVTSLETKTIAAVHQQVSFRTTGMGSFILVIDLPLLDHGDPGSGGGCALRRRPEAAISSSLPDTILFFSPLLALFMKIRKRWSAVEK
ncbi:MAG: hypothetical protein GXP58_04440 [Deltaproteobacteria bacterium]|nr:hypothetical protein [Deltaproteobacteria bacterium]